VLAEDKAEQENLEALRQILATECQELWGTVIEYRHHYFYERTALEAFRQAFTQLRSTSITWAETFRLNLLEDLMSLSVGMTEDEKNNIDFLYQQAFF
jgi:hypothetical protein